MGRLSRKKKKILIIISVLITLITTLLIGIEVNANRQLDNNLQRAISLIDDTVENPIYENGKSYTCELKQKKLGPKETECTITFKLKDPENEEDRLRLVETLKSNGWRRYVEKPISEVDDFWRQRGELGAAVLYVELEKPGFFDQKFNCDLYVTTQVRGDCTWVHLDLKSYYASWPISFLFP